MIIAWKKDQYKFKEYEKGNDHLITGKLLTNKSILFLGRSELRKEILQDFTSDATKSYDDQQSRARYDSSTFKDHMTTTDFRNHMKIT